MNDHPPKQRRGAPPIGRATCGKRAKAEPGWMSRFAIQVKLAVDDWELRNFGEIKDISFGSAISADMRRRAHK